MKFAACIILCISSCEKQIIWSVFLSHAFNFARLKRTSFCAIMTPSAPWWYLNERLSSENSRQWVLLRMRLKEETGTVRENTRNAFTERAKTDLPFFPFPFYLPPAFNYSSSGARLLPSWNLHNCTSLLWKCIFLFVQLISCVRTFHILKLNAIYFTVKETIFIIY